jgi:adenine-specific DNA glycosylase
MNLPWQASMHNYVLVCHILLQSNETASVEQKYFLRGVDTYINPNQCRRCLF